ncbi:MAG: response regulator [Sandaracinaceae bacterium]|nr:MAG: response regulator [Sandaracinaceae bacterium]
MRPFHHGRPLLSCPSVQSAADCVIYTVERFLSSRLGLTERRVLIVDDMAAVVRTTRRWLMRAGYEVRSALDAEAALSEAEAFRPHCVLLDVQLGERAGPEVAEALRERLPGVEIVLTSGGEAPVGWRGRFFEKTSGPHALLDALEAATDASGVS